MSDINTISVNGSTTDINKINLNGTEYNLGSQSIDSIKFELVATQTKMLSSSTPRGSAGVTWESDRNGCVILSQGCYVSGQNFTLNDCSILVNDVSYDKDGINRVCVGNNYTNRTLCIPIHVGDVVTAYITGTVSRASGSIISNLFASVIS